MLKYCYDRYQTQEMCDKAVVAYLPALKLVSNQFFTNKMLKKLDGAVFSNNKKVFADVESNVVIFFRNNMDLNYIHLNSINFDDHNFGDYILDINNESI